MSRVFLNKVIKRYGQTEVIHSVSLNILNGDFCVFVGPSGCGKSTLLRMIAGLEEVSGGTIYIGDKDVTALDPADRGVAMVFQTYALYPHMSVRNNMSFGLKMNGVAKNEIIKKVNKAANILKLTDYMDRLPKELSGGQRQRVAIGRAIVRGPDVFLFDEPLSNLDAELRLEMRVELARLHKELSTTMIYVTHDQTEAMTLADKIVVLRSGNIEQVGSPLELYANPDNKFVAGFIGSPSMNFLQGRVYGRGSGKYIELTALQQTFSPRARHLRQGDKIWVGLRPEHLNIKIDRMRQNTTGLRVGLHENLGGVSYVYLDANAGERIVVEDHGLTRAINVGDRVDINFRPKDALIFDIKSEHRIR